MDTTVFSDCVLFTADKHLELAHHGTCQLELAYVHAPLTKGTSPVCSFSGHGNPAHPARPTTAFPGATAVFRSPTVRRKLALATKAARPSAVTCRN
ncbi:uncharacterized protein LOC119456513 isoform X2 [Dermacentor silvarum]|uniref:uncharacterized protein LOC119456513 isoform X2 n=1 Tax=Dermacentor silvarum TaxID=543639 RepID=UPI002100EFE3|nr:uncharacterized protein LOC119456513 isoform X2 [Dermacentor silvarum]